MKQNKIKKYGLMVMFLMIGLFFCDTKVYAEDYVDIYCHYDFVYTQKNDNLATDYDISFNLFYSNNEWHLSGGEDGNRKALTFDTGNSKYQDYGNNSSCPQVVVYKRKSLMREFYVTNTKLKTNCDTTGKEKIDGYTCANIVGVYNGTDETSSLNQICPNDFITDLETKVKNKFNTVTSKYNSFWNEISKQKIDASSAATKEEADKICSSLLDKGNSYNEQLQQTFDQIDLDNFVHQEIDIKGCTLSNEQINNLTSKYINNLATYKEKIYNEAEHKKINCIQSANLDEKEKQELLEETEKESEEARKEIEEEADNLIEKYKSKITYIDLGENVGIDCEGLLGDDLLNLISEIFGYIQIAAPILLVVLGSVDFAQAVMSDDKDALKKATSKFVKRAIICVAIFFVPLILKYLLSFLNDMGKDPLCGIK